jgi:hypothetical protein
MSVQHVCLLAMSAVGYWSLAVLTDRDWRLPRRKRILWGAWLVFWLGPPLYFIWTKGVLG